MHQLVAASRKPPYHNQRTNRKKAEQPYGIVEWSSLIPLSYLQPMHNNSLYNSSTRRIFVFGQRVNVNAISSFYQALCVTTNPVVAFIEAVRDHSDTSD